MVRILPMPHLNCCTCPSERTHRMTHWRNHRRCSFLNVRTHRRPPIGENRMDPLEASRLDVSERIDWTHRMDLICTSCQPDVQFGNHHIQVVGFQKHMRCAIWYFRPQANQFAHSGKSRESEQYVQIEYVQFL